MDGISKAATLNIHGKRNARTSNCLSRINLLLLKSAHCENTVVPITDTNAVEARQILRGAVYGYET
jgi:hypothetical protein